MKKMSSREQRLLSTTALVIVVMLSWMIVRRQLDAQRDRSRRLQSAQSQLALQEEAMNMRPTWIAELQRIKGQLPRHPLGVDLKAGLSREVQNLAAGSGLTLTNLTPEEEVYLENLDVYKTSIRCGWRADSQELVSFLVRLQQRGPVLDVESLKLRKGAGRNKQMTGTFTLDFVYSREESTGTEPASTEEIAL